MGKQKVIQTGDAQGTLQKRAAPHQNARARHQIKQVWRYGTRQKRQIPAEYIAQRGAGFAATIIQQALVG